MSFFACGENNTFKSKIQQHCLKHPSEKYKYFCTSVNCLEILCDDCVKPHKDAHITFHEGQPQIYNLGEVQNYFEAKQNNSIEYEKHYQKQKVKQVDPCQILSRFIDDYFYGSVQNKIENQKARKQQMKNPSAKKLIEIIEKQSQYRVSDTFKYKYFQFLDNLLSQQP